MTQHTRQFEVERASVDAEAGTFEAVLFTDGEATDGHILNIKGGRIPDKFPLFVNHSSDPTTQLGSLHFSGKGDHEVRVRGDILLEGEGAPLEVRKDLLVKMAAGHVSRMSGRWDADEKNVKRRVNLPSDHPAFVDDSKETESRKKWGLYFEKWDAMEGSIVGLGADPQAVMRWANDGESPESVREFWRGQVPGAQECGLRAVLANATRAALDAGINPEEVADCVGALLPVQVEARAAALDAEQTAKLEALARLEAIADDHEEEPQWTIEGSEALEEIAATVYEMKQRLDAMDVALADLAKPAPAATEVQERVEEGDPLPPETPTAQEIIAHLQAEVDASNRELKDDIRARIKKARGGL